MLQRARHWLKLSLGSFAHKVSMVIKTLITISLPAPKWLFSPLYYLTCFLRSIWQACFRCCWWTPVFKGRLTSVGSGLYLYGGMPLVLGRLVISIGNQCRISGQTTFSGRVNGNLQPRLTLGNNIDIGWQTTIAVGTCIIIGDNVRIAGRAFLAGYPGHPFNAKNRAAGLPELDQQCGDIILERDVWLAMGVTVIAGVTIGEGTIVASGSVVTSDLPAFVVAGGVPAKVLRQLTPQEQST